MAGLRKRNKDLPNRNLKKVDELNEPLLGWVRGKAGSVLVTHYKALANQLSRVFKEIDCTSGEEKENDATSPETAIEILNNLLDAKVGIEVLEASKIARQVGRLRCHLNPDLAVAANRVAEAWGKQACQVITFLTGEEMPGAILDDVVENNNPPLNAEEIVNSKLGRPPSSKSNDTLAPSDSNCHATKEKIEDKIPLGKIHSNSINKMVEVPSPNPPSVVLNGQNDGGPPSLPSSAKEKSSRRESERESRSVDDGFQVKSEGEFEGNGMENGARTLRSGKSKFSDPGGNGEDSASEDDPSFVDDDGHNRTMGARNSETIDGESKKKKRGRKRKIDKEKELREKHSGKEIETGEVVGNGVSKIGDRVHGGLEEIGDEGEEKKNLGEKNECKDYDVTGVGGAKESKKEKEAAEKRAPKLDHEMKDEQSEKQSNGELEDSISNDILKMSQKRMERRKYLSTGILSYSNRRNCNAKDRTMEDDYYYYDDDESHATRFDGGDDIDYSDEMEDVANCIKFPRFKGKKKWIHDSDDENMDEVKNKYSDTKFAINKNGSVHDKDSKVFKWSDTKKGTHAVEHGAKKLDERELEEKRNGVGPQIQENSRNAKGDDNKSSMVEQPAVVKRGRGRPPKKKPVATMVQIKQEQEKIHKEKDEEKRLVEKEKDPCMARDATSDKEKELESRELRTQEGQMAVEEEVRDHKSAKKLNGYQIPNGGFQEWAEEDSKNGKKRMRCAEQEVREEENEKRWRKTELHDPDHIDDSPSPKIKKEEYEVCKRVKRNSMGRNDLIKDDFIYYENGFLNLLDMDVSHVKDKNSANKRCGSDVRNGHRMNDKDVIVKEGMKEWKESETVENDDEEGLRYNREKNLKNLENSRQLPPHHLHHLHSQTDNKSTADGDQLDNGFHEGRTSEGRVKVNGEIESETGEHEAKNGSESNTKCESNKKHLTLFDVFSKSKRFKSEESPMEELKRKSKHDYTTSAIKLQIKCLDETREIKMMKSLHFQDKETVSSPPSEEMKQDIEKHRNSPTQRMEPRKKFEFADRVNDLSQRICAMKKELLEIRNEESDPKFQKNGQKNSSLHKNVHELKDSLRNTRFKESSFGIFFFDN